MPIDRVIALAAPAAVAAVVEAAGLAAGIGECRLTIRLVGADGTEWLGCTSWADENDIKRLQAQPGVSFADAVSQMQMQWVLLGTDAVGAARHALEVLIDKHQLMRV